MESDTGWLKKLGWFVKNMFFSILAVIICTALAIGLISAATEQHAVIGAIVAVAGLIFAIWIGISDLRSVKAKGYSAWKGIRIFLITAFAGAVVFGEISYLLSIPGWAVYGPGEFSFHDLFGYYVYILIDLIPGLDVLTTMDLNMPVTSDGWVAGLMLLLFRALIVYGVIASFQIWWNTRITKETIQNAWDL